MAKRSPRLIFTEEERALPELERAVRKADRAAVKLEKAEAKIPKKTVKVKKRVVDSESGKVRRAFSLRRRTKSVRPPSWRTPQGKRRWIPSAAQSTASSGRRAMTTPARRRRTP